MHVSIYIIYNEDRRALWAKIDCTYANNINKK